MIDSSDEEIIPTRKQMPQIIINIYDTNYAVVSHVGQQLLKWKIISDPESFDWDVYWTDSGVQPEMISRMKCNFFIMKTFLFFQHQIAHQKINHFPGMFILARKNNLGKQLTKMKRGYSKEYNFFPQTWVIPSEAADFREYCKNKPNKVFIVKPEASCQGRGIFLIKGNQQLENDRYVVQKYLERPFLIDGLKFDFRIYVLVAGCDPLRLFIYTEGLARLSTEKFEEPQPSNFDNLCMHLTNYAINKNSEKFVFNEDETKMNIGHKRSMSSVFELLKSKGHDIDTLWMKIKQIVIKTLCAAQPVLKHQYTTCQPHNFLNNMCFEILGFDVIIDQDLRPYLLEVNHSPSFTTDSPLDFYIKSNLIQDTLVLMNINPIERQRIIQERSQEMKKRIMTGKNLRLSQEEKNQIIQQLQIGRNVYEDQNLGGYERIFPPDDDYEVEYYQKFLNYAQELFQDSTGTRKPQFIQKIQLSPQKQVKNKNQEIQQIYQRASAFLQKSFSKTVSQFGKDKEKEKDKERKQQQQVVREDQEQRFIKAEIAYKHQIQQQIMNEQKKIEQLIRNRKITQDEPDQKLSLSFQGQRPIRPKMNCESVNMKYRKMKNDK